MPQLKRLPKSTSTASRIEVYSIHGRNSFCGPAVVSALSGHSTDEAAYRFRNVMQTTRIKAVPFWALLEVLMTYGLTLKRDSVHLDDTGPRLGEWAAASSIDPKRVFVVAVPEHIGVVRNRFLWDTSHRLGWRLTETRLSGMTKRIMASWYVEVLDGVRI